LFAELEKDVKAKLGFGEEGEANNEE